MRRALIMACVLSWAAHVEAHSLALSVLELREVERGEFLVSWERMHALSEPNAAYLLLRPIVPPHCRLAPPRLSCGAAGLTGRIGFAGLGELAQSGMIRVHWQDGVEQAFSFSSAEPQATIAAPAQATPRLELARNFVWTGLEHIWLGWDHLLFVLGLFWLVRSLGTLIKTISAFTLAHTLTLCGTSLGFQVVPAAPVEAVIALSIAFVAQEIARMMRDGTPSFTGQHPWLVAFAFGLLHGLGFANALAEIAIAARDLPLALLCFNVGVELGQLAFVAALLGLRPLARAAERASGRRLSRLGYYAMGATALYWFCERVAAFGGSA
jgi:hypothetical protein